MLERLECLPRAAFVTSNSPLPPRGPAAGPATFSLRPARLFMTKVAQSERLSLRLGPLESWPRRGREGKQETERFSSLDTFRRRRRRALNHAACEMICWPNVNYYSLSSKLEPVPGAGGGGARSVRARLASCQARGLRNFRAARLERGSQVAAPQAATWSPLVSFHFRPGRLFLLYVASAPPIAILCAPNRRRPDRDRSS